MADPPVTPRDWWEQVPREDWRKMYEAQMLPMLSRIPADLAWLRARDAKGVND